MASKKIVGDQRKYRQHLSIPSGFIIAAVIAGRGLPTKEEGFLHVLGIRGSRPQFPMFVERCNPAGSAFCRAQGPRHSRSRTSPEGRYGPVRAPVRRRLVARSPMLIVTRVPTS